MNTIKLKAHTGPDGLLKFEIPTTPNQEFEIVLVLQAVQAQAAVDDLGWPVGFFEETYGSLADDPIELGPELPPAARDAIE
ncbi:MAG: hypothetical protein CL610_16915 [Anaerolineaceae bacterium]|nr:hypothetical protein [Anaerolineaceae bacterium]